jgi:succinate dehydrogenase / fumarate reductase membrane anchor subunit
MMKSATSFSRSGLSDWLVQRVSAVILAVYFVVVLGFILSHHGLSYADWHDFMTTIAMRVFNLLALLSLVGHAWIGIWTVLTDYVTARQMGPSANFLRLILQIGMGLMIFVFVVWGIQIFWGN